MKKMLKMVALLTAIALLAGMLFGCGKTTDKDEQGRTIISVGEWPSKAGEALDTANAKKARFEEANSDVVIEGDQWVFDRKTFYAKAAGGQLPTVYRAGFTEIAEIANSEYSADLSKALEKYGYADKINKDVLEAVSYDGKVVAFPSVAYVLGLAYNTDLFAKAGLMEADGTPKQPKDWDEVAEFAVKIKEATGKPGIILNTANNAGGWIFTNIAWSFGVDFMEKDKDGKWHATFDTPEAAAALQWVKDLKWKYDVLPGNTIIDGAEAQKLYATGNGAMYITAGDIYAKVGQYEMNPDHLGIMAMPAGPKRHVTLLGGGVYCVSPDATEDQVDAALRWIETEYGADLTDELKTNTTINLQRDIDEGRLVGIKGLSRWSKNTESRVWNEEMIDKMANSNPNHVRLYNEFVADCPAEIQPEEPVCCQELYGILDNCIQAVLTDKNADPAELMKKAAADFQRDYLDNLTY